jgi:ABC-2 type transport system ATP-binding protein
VLSAVKNATNVKDVRVSENKLIVDTENPEVDNPEIVRVAVAAGANIQYVTELKSTLEDVYLKVIREASPK